MLLMRLHKCPYLKNKRERDYNALASQHHYRSMRITRDTTRALQLCASFEGRRNGLAGILSSDPAALKLCFELRAQLCQMVFAVSSYSRCPMLRLRCPTIRFLLVVTCVGLHTSDISATSNLKVPGSLRKHRLHFVGQQSASGVFNVQFHFP